MAQVRAVIGSRRRGPASRSAARVRFGAAAVIGSTLLAPGFAEAQDRLLPRAALPAVPYWWPVRIDGTVRTIPLAWYNDVDGVVVGAGTRHDIGDVRLWWGFGLGLTGEGTQPAGFEAAAQLPGGSIALRRLHGRGAVTIRTRHHRVASGITVAAGLGVLWLDDEEYLDRVVLFDCPGGSVATPCVERVTGFGWSPGRDHAIELEAVRTSADGSAELSAALITGLELAGGDHDYLRATLAWRRHGGTGDVTWNGRIGAGWTSGDAPLQRRFYLHGGDPVVRWLNPMLETRGGAFSDVPYAMETGPGLRAYTGIRGLVKRFLVASGEIGRTHPLSREFWGRFAAFADLAWTPGMPDRIGPELMNPGGALVFDWRQLPDGEDEPQGRFRARVLEPPSIWADAGIALTAGTDRAALRLSLPLWANHPGFADESPLDGGHRALQTRWAITVLLQPFADIAP